MWNVLNALVIFGKEIPWTLEQALFWLLVAQVALILFMIVIFAILIRRMRNDVPTVEIPEPERKLLSLSLDVSMVRRKFPLGAEFDCGGLILTANYNTDPVGEVVSDYTIVSPDALKNGEGLGELFDCVVIAPDMNEPGKHSVTVNYHGKAAVYMVAVGVEDEEAAPIVQPIQPVPFDFNERILLGITLETGIVRREFQVGDEFECEGLIVMAHYSKAPFTEAAERYTIALPDMSEEGKKAVTVIYQEHKASYAISVVPAEEEGAEERELVGITLDTGVVRREFTVGEAFECEGLIVTANFNAAPFTEPAEIFEVGVPDMSEEGKKAVTVTYEGHTATYAISVLPAEEEEPAPVAVAVAEAAPRTLIGLTLETGVVRREFNVGDEFECDGLVVMANYSAEPYSEQVEDYEIEIPAMNEEGKPVVTVTYEGKSAAYAISVIRPEPERELVGITLDTGVVRREFTVGEEFECAGLVVTANYSAEPYSEQVEDFAVTAPDMNEEGKPFVTVTYREKAAVYAISVTQPEPEPEAAPAEDKIAHEVSYDGQLRYDKSFEARLIQSDDDIKRWYSDIKNEFLSYKKTKARMSWKKEIFRIGRNTVGRFGFRGKTLCLFLPLDPMEFEGTKYRLEDVSDNASFSETPAMFRIKNDRRAKYAEDLIALIAAELAAPRIEREAEDFYLPYKGVVELVRAGLIKRNVTNAAKNVPAETEIAPGLIVKAVTRDGKEIGAAEPPAEPEAQSQTAETAAPEAIPETAPLEAQTENGAPMSETEAQETPAEAPAETVAEPVDEPIPYTELPDEPAPVEGPAPAEEPAPIEEPAPAEEPSEEPVEAPLEEVAAAELPEEAPAEEPVEALAEEIPVEAPVEAPAEEPAPIEVPAEEPAPAEEAVPAEEPAETLVEEPAPAEEPAETPVDAPAEEEVSAETPAEEPAEGPAEGDGADEPIPYTELPDGEDGEPKQEAHGSLSAKRRKNRKKHR